MYNSKLRIKLAILLATYNGSDYLEIFLRSLKQQIFQDFDIISRDDGSSDGSLNILKIYTKLSKNFIFLDESFNLGIKQNFLRLMNDSLEKSYEYVMFADQDDVWGADKVEKTYKKMRELEGTYGKNTPLLVHSDLTVVDKDLNVIFPSFWEYQNINPNKQKLSDFLIANNVTGCTIMINQALVEKVKKIPQEAIMHDWWIAMVASAFGKIAYIDEPLMLYRQHGKNDIGAKKYNFHYIWTTCLSKFTSNHYQPKLDKYIKQSQAFLFLYGHELDDYQRAMLEEFSVFERLSKYQKLRVLLKYKIWKNGFMRNLGLVFFA